MSEDREKIRRDQVKLIQALLISAKGGVPLEKLNKDYRETVGKNIPYRSMGYNTLEDFLDQSPDMCKITYSSTGGIVLHGVATEATAHVAALVARQRKGQKAKPPARPKNLRPWQPPAPSQPFRGQSHHRYQSAGRTMNRPGGSGRFTTLQNRSPQALQQYQQQRLRTPNYSQNGGNSHMGNSNRGGRGGRTSAPRPRSSERPNYQQQQQQPPLPKTQTQPPKNNVNSVQLLEQHFAQNNLGELTFKTATMEMKSGGGNNPKNKAKKVTRFVSTVKVLESNFQTFPNSFPTKEQAEEAAAAMAIAKLDISSHTNSTNNNSVMSMPIGHFEPESAAIQESNEAIEPLVDIILELVGKRSNGVWSTQIDVEYKKKYNRNLPDKWPDKIEASDEASKKLRVDKPIADRYIIYPVIHQIEEELRPDLKVESNKKPASEAKKNKLQSSLPRSPATTPATPTMQKRPPKLQLPDEPTWDVYITCVHSTVNVCLRILGDNYSSQFDDMVTNMELKYFENNEDSLVKELVISNPEVGHLYAAKVEGDWHRVEVTNVHGFQVTCYFIDHGDEDVLKVTDLRRLLPEFLELAPQAKSVRLAGLEDLAGDASAQSDLTNSALGKSLVCQVHSKDEAGISIILYDTSNSEEDININEKLVQIYRSNNGALKNGGGSSSSNATPSRRESPGPPPLECPSEMSRSEASSPIATVEEIDLKQIDVTTLKPLVMAEVPEVEDFFDITVTLAASPSNFTVQPWQNTSTIEDFQEKFNKFYNDPRHSNIRTITPNDMIIDKYYAGHHMDGKWYRVKVNSTLDESTVAAKMVDFGDYTMIPMERLQPLWPQFRTLPMQAINASLADIVAINGDWSTEDTLWFSERVVNHQFVSRIRDISYDPLEDNIKISVSLVDTTHPTTDIYIEKELVNDKRAVYLCL